MNQETFSLADYALTIYLFRGIKFILLLTFLTTTFAHI